MPDSPPETFYRASRSYRHARVYLQFLIHFAAAAYLGYPCLKYLVFMHENPPKPSLWIWAFAIINLMIGGRLALHSFCNIVEEVEVTSEGVRHNSRRLPWDQVKTIFPARVGAGNQYHLYLTFRSYPTICFVRAEQRLSREECAAVLARLQAFVETHHFEVEIRPLPGSPAPAPAPEQTS